MTLPPCPLCAWSDPVLMRSIDTSALIDEWQRAFQIDITAELQGIRRIDLFECERCHLQFFDPNHLAASAQLYAQLEKIEWYYMPRWEHAAALEDLRSCETMLEVGCGFGDFVARARASGIQAEGIELNDSAVKTAQQRGVPVQRLDLRELAEHRSAHYDAVCSFQVLEHVPNPREFLEWSCALIKPGGQLIIGVPNALSFLKNQFDPLDMPPHHMTRWSSRTMQSLAQWLPVRLQHLRYEPLAQYHIVPYIRAQELARLKNRWLRHAFDVLIAPSVGLVLNHTRLRRKLIGQAMYVSFVRV